MTSCSNEPQLLFHPHPPGKIHATYERLIHATYFLSVLQIRQQGVVRARALQIRGHTFIDFQLCLQQRDLHLNMRTPCPAGPKSWLATSSSSARTTPHRSSSRSGLDKEIALGRKFLPITRYMREEMMITYTPTISILF